MSIKKLGFTAIVPGNAGRFFSDYFEAVEQPRGQIDFGWNEPDPYVFSTSFDESLVKYDRHYCTSVSNCANQNYIETKEYFFRDVYPFLPLNASVAEIGCGQGEFCSWLKSEGVADVRGYDPALRVEADGLFSRYWSPLDRPPDLFVMRCVLPHLPNPWLFCELMFENSPHARVLVEHQRLSWIFENDLWYQFSHDHVNQFRAQDFESRFRVLAKGRYAKGEWEWILFESSASRRADPEPLHEQISQSMHRLSAKRQEDLEDLVQRSHPMAVWGAAGKGTVLTCAIADAMVASGGGCENIYAIDSDQKRWGKYLECSGVQVMSPIEAMSRLPKDAQILISNPRHRPDIDSYVRERFQII
jgi:hypothetical protein